MLVDTTNNNNNNKQTNKQSSWVRKPAALFWSKDSLGGRKLAEMMWADVQGIPLTPSLQQAEEETGLWLAAAGSLLMMSLNMEASCWEINWKNIWDGCVWHVDADHLLCGNPSFISQRLPGYHLLAVICSREISEISSVFGSVSPRWPWGMWKSARSFKVLRVSPESPHSHENTHTHTQP